MTKIINVVSLSGGKDSTALALLAIEQQAPNLHFVFADTGHEHTKTYEYLDYLRDQLQIEIHVVRANFDRQILNKRIFIANDQRIGRRNGKKIRWTNKAKRRALDVLKPTGIPFLDLMMLKGRFASTKARFCSSDLKHAPLDAFIHELAADATAVISWQGVRADESANRKHLPERDVEFGSWEPSPKGILIYRPLISWSVEDVFKKHRQFGIKPNPLYSEGMGRVGCMPCIHARKNELRNIAMRFPNEIARVIEWEKLVSLASKRGQSSFFAHADNRGANMSEAVEWSKTTRGNRNYDLINTLEEESPIICSSMYGLCE